MRTAGIVSVLLLTVTTAVCAPLPAAAATERAALRAELAALIERIEYLQSILAQRQVGAVVESREMLHLDTSARTDVSTSYRVARGELIAARGASVLAADAELFILLRDVLGPDRVREHVRHFSVFSDRESDLGGYVERKSGEEHWRFGVNRAAYEARGERSFETYADLYLHEYAHVLADEHRDRLRDFTDQFWRSVDHRHARRVADRSGEERFTALLAYYERNEDRFVSDYATLAPEEDFAESFRAFVREPRPSGSAEVSGKIRFFYAHPDWQLLRNELRANLASLGLQ